MRGGRKEGGGGENGRMRGEADKMTGTERKTREGRRKREGSGKCEEEERDERNGLALPNSATVDFLTITGNLISPGNITSQPLLRH